MLRMTYLRHEHALAFGIDWEPDKHKRRHAASPRGAAAARLQKRRQSAGRPSSSNEILVRLGHGIHRLIGWHDWAMPIVMKLSAEQHAT